MCCGGEEAVRRRRDNSQGFAIEKGNIPLYDPTHSIPKDDVGPERK